MVCWDQDTLGGHLLEAAAMLWRRVQSVVIALLLTDFAVTGQTVNF